MSAIRENLEKIQERMARAAKRVNRDPDSVRLVAVSKRVDLEKIQEAMSCGQTLFGENYLQESELKIAALGPAIDWHFIGHLQSNKARTAATIFNLIETIDRLKLARSLNASMIDNSKVMDVLVQVNVGREIQKSGVMPENVESLLLEMQSLSGLRVKGLMTMPPFFDQPEAARPYFRQLRDLSIVLADKGLLGQYGPVELSMGMSGDFEVAIEEGATLVRVGTALFGARQ